MAAGSVYVLKLLGITLGGWMLARSAQIAAKQLAAGEGDADYLKGKILTARFFAEHILPQAPGTRQPPPCRAATACSPSKKPCSNE